MATYRFGPDVRRPQRINVYDPQGAHVAWLPEEAAMVIVTMYQSQVLARGAMIANELMYGYILGMTHAIIYREQFPSAKVTREAGAIKLQMFDPDGSAMMPATDIRDVPDGARHAGEMIERVDPSIVERDRSKDS